VGWIAVKWGEGGGGWEGGRVVGGKHPEDRCRLPASRNRRSAAGPECGPLPRHAECRTTAACCRGAARFREKSSPSRNSGHSPEKRARSVHLRALSLTTDPSREL